MGRSSDGDGDGDGGRDIDGKGEDGEGGSNVRGGVERVGEAVVVVVGGVAATEHLRMHTGLRRSIFNFATARGYCGLHVTHAPPTVPRT